MRKARGKVRKRERPLGQAIVGGLVVTLGVAIAIFSIWMAIPGSLLHNFYDLIAHASTATLPFDPLYQQWAEAVQRVDDLFVTPFSLLCGGLTVGLVASRQISTRRILRASALLGIGIVVATLVFIWIPALYNSRTLAAHEGGEIAVKTAPLEYILRQAGIGIIWVGICVLGTGLGLRLRPWWVREEVNTSAPAPENPARLA